LESLCRIRSQAELAKAIRADTPIETSAEIQQRLVRDLVDDFYDILIHLSGARHRLFGWLLDRFQLRNLKLVYRAFRTGASSDELQKHVIPWPGKPTLDLKGLALVKTLGELPRVLPVGPLYDMFREAILRPEVAEDPYLWETRLDRDYFRELLTRLNDLTAEDREVIGPMIVQEVDTFHLMLVLRFLSRADSPFSKVQSMHIEETRIPRQMFGTMLGSKEFSTAIAPAVGRALDVLPANPWTVEALAWTRFQRLANRSFRAGHMGFGVIAGYAGLRRIEVANLLTISEGIRINLASDQIRTRMLPRLGTEAQHV
jgi:vacuolar-type H+-ATPase subunit C/Vma6